MTTGETVDIGVQVFPGAPRRLVEEASIAEGLGFTSAWVADHYFGGGKDASWPVPEVVAILGAMTQRTSRIRIGTCVVSLQKRDPASVAQAALTLNHLSSGRFELGVGTGFGPDLRAFGIDVGYPASRLEEALRVIRGLFDASQAEPLTFEGKWFQLHEAFLNIPETAPPPVHVASVGPRTLGITARLGDGWLPFGLSPELYGDFLQAMSPSRPGFVPGLWIPMFLESAGEDRSAEAEATGRLYLSMAPAVLEKALGDAHHVSVDGATGWSAETGRASASVIPPDLARAVTLVGPPDRCAETIAAFMDSGCRRFILRVTDAATREKDIEYFARTVLQSFVTSGS